MQQSPIKNIIFDLGGVFMNIDFAKTEKAFRDLGVMGFSTMFTQHHANDLFEKLETGHLTPEAFYAAFRQATNNALTDEQIRDAWNMLLLDFPLERLEWLEKIQQQYNLFLFSNTNLIHYIAFMDIYRKTTDRKGFNDFFIKAYYSHEMGLRKPYVEAYQYIIAEQNLVPEETLFIDDTEKNIIGAKAAGLQTFHLHPPLTVLDLAL